MKKKYKEFADKFEALCDKFAPEDFDVKEVKQVCGDIIDNYGEWKIQRKQNKQKHKNHTHK